MYCRMLSLMVLVIVLFSPGCELLDGPQITSTKSDPDAAASYNITAGKTGAIVAGPRGSELVIPEGAFTENVDIQFEVYDLVVPDIIQGSDVYALKPVDLVAKKPVTLRIPFKRMGDATETESDTVSDDGTDTVTDTAPETDSDTSTDVDPMDKKWTVLRSVNRKAPLKYWKKVDCKYEKDKKRFAVKTKEFGYFVVAFKSPAIIKLDSDTTVDYCAFGFCPMGTCVNDPDGYHCECATAVECDSGYQDNDSDFICQMNCAASGVDCGEYGMCSDVFGMAMCVCGTGYTGSACSECADGYIKSVELNMCIPKPVCIDHAYQQCDRFGRIFWHNSCGEVQDMAANCTEQSLMCENTEDNAARCVLLIGGTSYFFDGFEKDLSNWELSGASWERTTTLPLRGDYCVTDSVDSNYAKDTVATLTMKNSIDITDAIFPVFSFWYKLKVSNDSDDTGVVQLSFDGGVEWYTVANLVETPLIKQDVTWNGWKLGHVYLGDLADKYDVKLDSVKARFILSADADSITGDGIWLDDIDISDLSGLVQKYFPTETTTEECESGYQDNDSDNECQLNCEASGLECGDYGVCDDASGIAICVCSSGYAGSECGECAEGYVRNAELNTCVSQPECIDHAYQQCDSYNRIVWYNSCNAAQDVDTDCISMGMMCLNINDREATCVLAYGASFFFDGFESDLNSWELGEAGWEKDTTDPLRGEYCLTDSPDNNYSPGAQTMLTMKNAVDLSDAAYPVLTFWYKLKVSNDLDDIGAAEISFNDSGFWSRAFLMKETASADTDISWNAWQLGYVPLAELAISQEASLKSVKVRFILSADSDSTTGDGIWLDNIDISDLDDLLNKYSVTDMITGESSGLISSPDTYETDELGD